MTINLSVIWNPRNFKPTKINDSTVYVKYYQDPRKQYNRDNFWPCMHCDLDLSPRVKIMKHHWIVEINMLSLYALWPWLCRYDPESRSRHTIELMKIIVWISTIQIQVASVKLWLRHTVLFCLHCDLTFEIWPCVNVMKFGLHEYVQSDLDLQDMILGKCHDTTLNHGQQFSEFFKNIFIDTQTITFWKARWVCNFIQIWKGTEKLRSSKKCAELHRCRQMDRLIRDERNDCYNFFGG